MVIETVFFFFSNSATFQQVDFRSSERFWTSLSNNMSGPSISTMKSAEEWNKWLRDTKSKSSEKRKVFFFDEFDSLYYFGSDDLIDHVLATIRSWREERLLKVTKNTIFFLKELILFFLNHQSFIGIGPFSIQELVGRKGSPFNVRESVYAPNFNEDEVKALFASWTKYDQRTVDPEILDDIFNLTKGYVFFFFC